MSSTEPTPSAEPTGTTPDVAAERLPEAGQTIAAEGATDDGATPEDGGPEVEIDDLVDRSAVRRAPRYKAFFWTGALSGIVLGLAFGLYLITREEAAGLLKPGVYLTVIVLSVTMVTVLIAGFLAILADRRSLRRRGR